MKLKKCPSCKTYTLKDKCEKCKEKTKQAGYKFKEYSVIPSNLKLVIKNNKFEI